MFSGSLLGIHSHKQMLNIQNQKPEAPDQHAGRVARTCQIYLLLRRKNEASFQHHEFNVTVAYT